MLPILICTACLISIPCRWQVVFKPDVWPMFEPLLRADFTLFDTYSHDSSSESEASATHSSISQVEMGWNTIKWCFFFGPTSQADIRRSVPP